MDRLKYFLLVWLVAVLPAMLAGCKSDDDDPDQPTSTFDVDFELPASIVAPRNDDYVFAVKNQKAPLVTDQFLLENASGLSYEATITKASAETFSVSFPKSLKDGNYRVYIKRGDRKKGFGTTSIRFVDRIITPAEGSTVYGFIGTPDGKGVKDVLVSDGYEIVKTDADGVYQMKSKKELGYVFFTLPANYEAQADGVFPRIYETTKLGESAPERIDFTITPVTGQENFKILFLGDMHLANRTNDLNQFDELTKDITNYRASHGSEKVYGITLGDMTWDIYWYTKKYGFNEYRATINEKVKNMQIFHVIGNHDNDYLATNNIAAKMMYRTTISPNYYSFNIGQVHFVVLDDIDCSTYDGTTSRNYVEQVVNEQITWLANDLKYVDKSTPVIVMMHAPLYYPSTATKFKLELKNGNELLSALDGYKVHFVTGHTHKNYNVLPSDAVTNGKDVYEHNVAAVCGDWWWSGQLSPGYLMAPDGSPAGYAIWDFQGKTPSYIYKGTQMNENVQFRSYDLNNVSFSFADVPNLSSTATVARLSFQRYISAYPGKKNNEVLINVWAANNNWDVTVKTESGKNLTVSQVMAYDPLHIAAMSVKRFNDSSITSAPNFITQQFNHFYKVTAPDADTDLVITVKDEFGHTWIENMARPKAFSVESYKFR